MNGVHDMGGMHGFGTVLPEQNEPVFHEAWEGRVYTMLRQLNGKFPPKTPGAGRDIIEHIEPSRYLSMGYYERFLAVLEQRALSEGLVTAQEIDSRMRLIEKEGSDPVAATSDPKTTAGAIERLMTGQPHPAETGAPPRFAVGDPVRARNLNWAGHNRLPRYIRDKLGIVERINGLYHIEDARDTELGPSPQTVYTVRFGGLEVWGPEAEANLNVYLELWEGYLEPPE